MATTLPDMTAVGSDIKNQLALRAPLASPGLTGTPTAPTAAAGTKTTQIATTAFVSTAVANSEATLSSALSALITEYGGTVPS